MSTTIRINGLKLPGAHGVFAQESKVSNMFIFDLIIEADCFESCFSDDLNATIDYAMIIETIKRINKKPTKLIENLAWRINTELRAQFKAINHLTVTVTKSAPPIPSVELHSISFTLTTT